MPNGISTVEDPDNPPLGQQLRAFFERRDREEEEERQRRREERQSPDLSALFEMQRGGVDPTADPSPERQSELEQSREMLRELVDVGHETFRAASELALGMSPITGYKELFEIAKRTEPGELLEVVKAMGAAEFEEADAALGEILGRSPTAQRQAALQTAATGGLVEFLGSGLANTMELVPEAVEALPDDIKRNLGVNDLVQSAFFATETSKEAFSEFATEMDRQAIALGASPEDVIGAKISGGFVGFTPAIFASLKVASLLPFARGAGFRPMFTRDLIAGGILGGTVTEGDLKERAMAAASESAFFGAWSAALISVLAPVRAFRARRMMQKMEDRALERYIRRVEETFDPESGTLNIRNLDADQGKTLFQILSEEQMIAESSRAGELLIRNADETALVPAILGRSEGAQIGIIRGVRDPDRVVQKLETEFPELAIEVSKGEVRADILFGVGGLPEGAAARYTAEGRFPGQRLLVAGQEVEYVGRGTKGRIKVKRIDSGKEISVSEEIVQDLPLGFGESPKQVGVLAQDFTEQLSSRLDQVIGQRLGLTEQEIVQAAREGTLAEKGISVMTRRDFPVENAFGLRAEMGVRTPSFTQQEARQIIAQEGLETFHILDPAEPLTFRQLVRSFAEDLGLVGPIPEGTRVPALRQEIQGEELLVDVLTAEASRIMKQKQWRIIPREEKRLLTELRDQVIRTVEDLGPSLEREAASSGFSIRRTESGAIQLTEVNTGFRGTFETVEGAREALKGVERQLGDNVGRSSLPRFPDDTPFTSHLPEADDFLITGRVTAGEITERMTPNPKFTNLSRWSQEFEESTGIPMWSRAFEPLDQGNRRTVADQESWLRRVMATWKDLSKEERVALDPFWQQIAGRQLSRDEMVTIAKELGLSAKQRQAAFRALETERAAFPETDLPPFRYLDNHFARIRSTIEREGQLPQDVSTLMGSDLPQGAKAFWQKARTGELAQREADPLVVQLKYFRSVFWDKHVRGPWERANAMLGPKSDPFNFSQLEPGRQSRLIETFMNREGVEKAHRVMKEYLGRSRGLPSEGERAALEVFDRVTKKLNLDIPGEVLQDATNIYMSVMYGAAMAGRPRMLARNLTQNLWFGWMRLDSDVLGRSLERVLRDKAAWRQAHDAGSLRPQQRGLFAGESAFEGHLANLPEREGVKKASDAVMRGIFNVGNAARKTSSVGMIPFGASDDINRAWAHVSQRMHTNKYLTKLKNGEISEKEFFDEGLRGHSPTVKREFARRFDLLGEEEALQFAGKAHADQAHFIYARLAQPLWMQGDVGKFGGMFGTYSIWSKDYLVTMAKNMTPKQRAQMAAKGAAMGSALFLVGSEMGFDLNSWLSPLSAFTYTGGPPVESVQNLREVMGNVTWNPARAAQAAQRLGEGVFRLSVPGQALQNDFMQANEMAEDLPTKVLSFMLARPERSRGNFWTDIMLPHEDGVTTPQDNVLDILRQNR